MDGCTKETTVTDTMALIAVPNKPDMGNEIFVMV